MAPLTNPNANKNSYAVYQILIDRIRVPICVL